MMGRKKFNMKQHHNLCLDDLVSPGDLYRKIDEAIDFTFIHDLAKDVYSHTGQPSLDPIVFFKIELVGFLEGIHEDRALERRIKDSLAIRWFLGYDLDEAVPVHSTISRARKDRISKTVYQAVFDHILGLYIRHQLVKGHHQSIDSTLLKANACLASLELLQPKVLEHYEKTVGGNSSKAADNATTPTPTTCGPQRRDQEAKAAKKPGFLAAAYYKASASVDEAFGIITHAQVDDGNKNDAELLQSIVQQTKNSIEKHHLVFESLATDKGFYSAENLNWLREKSLVAYMTPRRLSTVQGDFSREKFRYDTEKDQFICPEGKKLYFRQVDHDLSHLRRYRAHEKDCASCVSKSLCTKGKARTLQFSIHDNLITEALERSKSPRAKIFDRLRRIQAEGTFANLKEVLKFKKLYSLGRETASKRFMMGCAVINLKKLLRFWRHFWQLFCQTLQLLKDTIVNQVGLTF
ncbi:MAG: IS1182 family transposase [Candidatus Omnitrophota bacterium]|nr:IS1182 family transposase [Candidatus Omnitrophota bacterium]